METHCFTLLYSLSGACFCHKTQRAKRCTRIKNLLFEAPLPRDVTGSGAFWNSIFQTFLPQKNSINSPPSFSCTKHRSHSARMKSIFVVLCFIAFALCIARPNTQKPMLRKPNVPELVPTTLRKNPEAYKRILVRRPVTNVFCLIFLFIKFCFSFYSLFLFTK